jgi:hypothetical protein
MAAPWVTIFTMPATASIILLAWLAVSIALFWVLPMRRAAMACLLGGWALLPNRAYPPPADAHNESWRIMATALPADAFLTKAVAVGGGTLAGLLLRRPRAFAGFRPRWLDLPMALWCVCPMFNSIAGETSLAQGARDGLYLLLAWGAPYVVGRVCLVHRVAVRELAVAIVLAGLLYIPLCAVEWVAGPRLYAALYGQHPFAPGGAQRYIGHRPLGLLEDGNQLGMWMSGSALVAVWLWRCGALPRMGFMAPGAIAAVSLIAAVACQSVGSILLMLAGLAALWSARWLNPRILLVGLLAALGLFVIIRASNLLSARRFAEETPAGRWLVQVLRDSGRGSLGWRIGLDEKHVRTVMQRPLTGWGQWDWWRGGDWRPWGLWLLVLGQFGIIGLASVYAMMLGAAVRFAFNSRPAMWREPSLGPAAALATLLVMTMLDSLLNSAVVLPVAAAAGALAIMPLHGSDDGPDPPVHRRQ